MTVTLVSCTTYQPTPVSQSPPSPTPISSQAVKPTTKMERKLTATDVVETENSTTVPMAHVEVLSLTVKVLMTEEVEEFNVLSAMMDTLLMQWTIPVTPLKEPFLDV